MLPCFHIKLHLMGCIILSSDIIVWKSVSKNFIYIFIFNLWLRSKGWSLFFYSSSCPSTTPPVSRGQLPVLNCLSPPETPCLFSVVPSFETILMIVILNKSLSPEITSCSHIVLRDIFMIHCELSFIWAHNAAVVESKIRSLFKISLINPSKRLPSSGI